MAGYKSEYIFEHDSNNNGMNVYSVYQELKRTMEFIAHLSLHEQGKDCYKATILVRREHFDSINEILSKLPAKKEEHIEAFKRATKVPAISETPGWKLQEIIEGDFKP